MTDGDMKLIIKEKKVGRIELKILEFFFFSLLNYRTKFLMHFLLVTLFMNTVKTSTFL